MLFFSKMNCTIDDDGLNTRGNILTRHSKSIAQATKTRASKLAILGCRFVRHFNISSRYLGKHFARVKNPTLFLSTRDKTYYRRASHRPC